MIRGGISNKDFPAIAEYAVLLQVVYTCETSKQNTYFKFLIVLQLSVVTLVFYMDILGLNASKLLMTPRNDSDTHFNTHRKINTASYEKYDIIFLLANRGTVHEPWFMDSVML